MSLVHDEFIKKFKRLERAIRDKNGEGSSYKWLEDRVSDEHVQTQMRLCRLMRNYIQHETDYESFVAVSSAQLQLLDSLYKSVSGAKMACEMQLNSVNTCVLTTDSLSEACKKLQSFGSKLPVVDAWRVCHGCIDIDTVMRAIADGKAASVSVGSLGELPSVETIGYSECIKPVGLQVVVDASGYVQGWF